MIQGVGSDVGKSLVVAGLCRVFRNRGLSVRPFKPQNMSNNAAVTADGGEIGRAQALQARACGAPASVHMNPVLLKPQSLIGSQIVVQGKVTGTANARDYQALKPRLMGAVLESFERLRGEADLVIVEGAGSAAEINLRANDIANMGFARAADVPVIVLGDIDRGGVIAQIVGTRVVIAPEDAALVAGFLVNRFRGDPTLFEAGLQAIATSRRLGAVVEVFDTRPAVKEEVLSLGAKFIEVEGAADATKAGGYAVEQTEDYKNKQQQRIAESIAKADIVITTAQIPGKKAPILVTGPMLDSMRTGSVIIDLAASTGGNTPETKNNETVQYKGVRIIGDSNLAASMPSDASKLYGKNVLNFLQLLLDKEGKLAVDFNDDLVKGACMAHAGTLSERLTS
jgi:cobyric acid synthase